MTKLYYIGPPVVGVVPLPEGWPSAPEHEEPNADIAREKLAFKLNGAAVYSRTAPKGDGPEEKE